MPTYMFQGCYTAAAMAVMVNRPQDRSIVIRTMVEGLGGKMEGFWLSFGEYNYVGIAQLPDSQTAAAFGFAAAANGAVCNLKIIELLTWSEGVKAFKKAAGAKYRPPMRTGK